MTLTFKTSSRINKTRRVVTLMLDVGGEGSQLVIKLELPILVPFTIIVGWSP